MSDKEQDSETKPQECSAVDVEMNSQLTDAAGESQGSALMEEECSNHQGDNQQPTEAEEQMSQDGDIEPTQQNGDTEPAATPSVDQRDDQEAVVLSEQEEGEKKELGAAAAVEGVADLTKEKDQTGKEEEEEMASQGSTSDSDSYKEPVAKPSFPGTLEEFGYHFKEGKLRSIKKDEPFMFEVRKGKKKYNQAHYEALGEVITEEVYRLLETEANLKKVEIPLKPKKKEPVSFIYRSEDALINPSKLMVLIHGSGVVRAGQWARSLIINDCIDSGTQIPYIKRAMKEGYGVIVLNTNYNRAEPDGTVIRGSSSPQEHAQYVWKHFIKEAKAKQIYIVAHSFGGVVTVDLMVAKFDEFKKRVRKIAFTDSVHILHSKSVSHKARKWIIEHAVNWVTSDHPLNEELESHSEDVTRRSAGTQKHVETSWFSFEHIFTFFSET